MADANERLDKHHRMPRFDLTIKTYEQYRFELECWHEITGLPKKKQGIEVLLSLPESDKDEFKTREFLTAKLTKAQLTDINSYATVLDKLDEHLRRDDTGRLWESFVDFDSFSRGSLPISEYISRFDILYNKLNKCGAVTLPDSILGLLLVRRANLTAEEVKLVLTGLDYTKNTTLFVQAKASLRKEGVLRCHPDLAGRLAMAGQLTAESTQEQKAAGLDQLAPEEITAMTNLNRQYKAKFGFPFVICARLNNKEAILSGLTDRLTHSRQEETLAGLEEVKKICRLRIADIVTSQPSPQV